MDDMAGGGEKATGRRGTRARLAAGLRFLAEAPARAYGALVAKEERRRWGVPLFALLVAAVLYALLAPLVMALNYRFPSLSVSAAPASEGEERVLGTAYVDALLHVHEEGLRPWLPNDRVYPTIFLDNPQSHQLGQLEGVRYAVRVLRDNLSRLRSTDAIDEDINEAHTRLNIAAESWMFPRAEAEYAAAMKALRRYRERLVAGKAHFFPRADNLVELINQFNSLTGGANTRLHACIGDFRARLSEETIDDPYLQGETLLREKVPWSKVDDQFYYAQGVAFVYREIMAAVTVEFREVLELRNADELAHAIVHDFLDRAQFEPVYVANGGLGSMWANHPAQLLSLLSQVRERSRSLVTMLDVNVH